MEEKVGGIKPDTSEVVISDLSGTNPCYSGQKGTSIYVYDKFVS